MKRYEQEQLLALLDQWFNETNLNNTNIFNQNKIAARIKKELTKEQYSFWVNKRRGKTNKENLINSNKNKELARKIEQLNKLVLKCPHCGDNLILSEDKKELFCDSFTCGKTILKKF